ncbi:MAG: tetratricopeptide repeat protein [Spirochaetales bacterium]|nr:tetratricopeptide repeat protein [Spirochaetales bacterium]
MVRSQQTPGVRERAVEALQHNRLDEALPLLELAVTSDPSDAEAVRMLAFVLEQVGRVDEAEVVLRQGMERDWLTGPERSRFAFDLGALYARQDRDAAAVEMYGTSLEFDGAMASSYLNRANTHVALGGYDEAVRDYRFYLALRPSSAQRSEIERMIALLTQTIETERIRQEAEEARRIAEEEAQRVAEAERSRREEAARIAEERRIEEELRAAEVRRQAVLDSVLQSLSTATDEAQSFELDNEDIRTYEEDIDILD